MISTGSPWSGFLLAFACISSAVILEVTDRGCISTDSVSVCATRGEVVDNDGWLMAGFPPFHYPRYTFPYCREYYSVPHDWDKIVFNVDTWRLTGEKGEFVVGCKKARRYKGMVQRSPYNRMDEGSELGQGSHQVSWENAFPQTLKSNKELKSSSTDSVNQEDLGLSAAPQQGEPSGDDSSIGNTVTEVTASNGYDASDISDASQYDAVRFDSEVPPPSLEQNEDVANNDFVDIETPEVPAHEGTAEDQFM